MTQLALLQAGPAESPTGEYAGEFIRANIFHVISWTHWCLAVIQHEFLDTSEHPASVVSSTCARKVKAVYSILVF